MTDEWKTNSLCVSSTDSDRYTEIGEYQNSYEEADYNYQFGRSAKRFAAYTKPKPHANTPVGVFLRNLKPIPVDPLIDPIFSTCFNCWQFGHRYQECQLPNQHDFCVNCGRMNVLIQYCPRCSKAYDRYMQMKKDRLKGYQKPAGNFRYDPEYNQCHENAHNDVVQFEAKESHSQMNSMMSISSTSFTNLLEEYYYYSSDDSENYNDDVVIDEDEGPSEFVSQLLRDFLKLLKDVKPWPIEVQNTILLHFAKERCNQSQ